VCENSGGDIMITNGDTYFGDGAGLYDLFHPDIDVEEDINFYYDLLKDDAGVSLEPGCGTGRFLLKLLERGINIEGVDSSQEMLDICRQKANKIGINPMLYHATMQNFNISKEYDSIIIPFSSFMLITQFDDVRKTLLNFYKHLSSRGQLIIEIAAWHNIRPFEFEDQWLVDDIQHLSENKFVIQNVSESNDYFEGLRRIILKYEFFENNELIKTSSQQMLVKLYNKLEFQLLVESVGFKISSIYYGDCKSIPINKSHKKTVYVMKKT
jgi:SAM-dependent methyltransferase